MAKAEKTDKGSKEEAADKVLRSGVRKEGDVLILFRMVKGEPREVRVVDGELRCGGKTYETLKDAAEAVRGKPLSGSGRSFFGLRRDENKSYLKEVEKFLKAAPKAEAKPPKKAKKAKKAATEEDEDDAPAAKSVGEAVAKVFGKARR